MMDGICRQLKNVTRVQYSDSEHCIHGETEIFTCQ